MRLATLYLRSRRAGYACAGVSCVALLAWGAGHVILTRPSVVTVYLSPVLVFASLLAACLIAVGASSPFGDAERTASRSLPALRFGHLGGLLVWAALCFLLVTLLWGRGSAALVLLRDLAGLSGLALLAAGALGSRLSWTLPVAFVAVIPLVGDGSGDSRWAWWAWVDQPAGEPTSWALAVVLFVLGFGLVCSSGAANVVGEAE